MAEISMMQVPHFHEEAQSCKTGADNKTSYKNERTNNVSFCLQEGRHFEQLMQNPGRSGSESDGRSAADAERLIHQPIMVSPHLCLTLLTGSEWQNSNSSATSFNSLILSNAGYSVSAASAYSAVSATFAAGGISQLSSSQLSASLSQAINAIPIGQHSLTLLLGNLPAVQVNMLYQASVLTGLALKSEDARMQAWLAENKVALSRDLAKSLNRPLELEVVTHHASVSKAWG